MRQWPSTKAQMGSVRTVGPGYKVVIAAINRGASPAAMDRSPTSKPFSRLYHGAMLTLTTVNFNFNSFAFPGTFALVQPPHQLLSVLESPNPGARAESANEENRVTGLACKNIVLWPGHQHQCVLCWPLGSMCIGEESRAHKSHGNGDERPYTSGTAYAKNNPLV